MPKYKNGKVMYTRFKIQDLIRSKRYLYLKIKIKILQRDYEKLVIP
jgi:hypothetical protein